jgi:hypothetical protein
LHPFSCLRHGWLHPPAVDAPSTSFFLLQWVRPYSHMGVTTLLYGLMGATTVGAPIGHGYTQYRWLQPSIFIFIITGCTHQMLGESIVLFGSHPGASIFSWVHPTVCLVLMWIHPFFFSRVWIHPPPYGCIQPLVWLSDGCNHFVIFFIKFPLWFPRPFRANQC